MANKRVLCPLPDRDFDTTEVAVPWRLLTRAGHEVVFATERGAAAACDPLLLRGVLFGQLGADPEPRAFYRELEADAAFRAPIAWDALIPGDYDALLLPGGHAQGMKQYLASAPLQAKVREFAATRRPIAAICHGVLVAARAGILRDRTTTCLPKWMEWSAYAITAWKLGGYYRTYPAYVEDEVKSTLASPHQFVRGPLGLTRGTADDDRHAFVVEDGAYLSARWPGDAYLFAKRLLARL